MTDLAKSQEAPAKENDTVKPADPESPAAKAMAEAVAQYTDEDKAEVQRFPHVHILRKGDSTYHIVGTAHVSEESTKEVRELIQEIKPDQVCIELCESRYKSLTDENRWQKLDIFQVIKSGQTLYLLGNLAVGAYQRRMGAKLGVKPGAELLDAANAAKDVNAELCLIDRDINTTLKRTWANLGFFSKCGLLGAIFESLFDSNDKNEEGEDITREDIEKLKTEANLSTMMDEFAKEMPQVHKPLIDERDQFLSTKMKEAKGKNVVAVVGAGHVPGITRYFNEDIDIEPINKRPAPSKVWTVIKWLFPVILILSFVYGFYSKGFDSLQDMLLAWVLPNSIGALLFCLLAGAKPLSSLTSIFLSPITSLTPVIGTGVVVGLLEAWLRKPTVEDCERINEEAHTLKGFYKNPVTRTLIVAFMASMGSSIGAYVGLGWVISLLARL